MFLQLAKTYCTVQKQRGQLIREVGGVIFTMIRGAFYFICKGGGTRGKNLKGGALPVSPPCENAFELYYIGSIGFRKIVKS